jgi:hypothetical protein
MYTVVGLFQFVNALLQCKRGEFLFLLYARCPDKKFLVILE